MPTTTTAILHLYLHQPTAIFRARLNLASAIYPLTTLPFDGVTLGAFGDIAADQTLTLGSASGLDDYGRVRVQNVATSTNIPVGRISQGTDDGALSAIDNAYITVWNDFRVWAKIPYDAPSGIDYKDSNVLVGNYLTTAMPPVANCGPGTAGTINAGTSLLTVAFDGTASYAMADGATITTYAWDLQGGTVTVGTLSSSTLTATFPAGFYWVGLTVTDSNGTPHTARCSVLAVNPAADVTVENFQVESHRIMQEGQTLGFRVLEDVPRTTYPDGCLVMYWWNEPASASDRTHMKFIGWHQSDSVNMRAQQTGLLRDTVLHCVDVAGRLASLPSFPQALQRKITGDVDIMWSLMPGLTMRRCLHYLAFWHSTALGVADFILPAALASYPAMRLDSVGNSLFDQINTQAMKTFPDYLMTCNTLGQLRVIADWMLQDVVDRPAATATITEDYWSDIRLEYNRPPRVYALRGGAIVCSTDWLMLGAERTVPLAFCVAPNTDAGAFGQGVSEVQDNEGLTISQAALNSATGHKYARLNARYGPFSIGEPSGSISVWGYEPANMARVTLNISAATAAQRGLDFTTANGMIKAIDLRYNHTKQGTWISPTLTWEKETVGFAAVTLVPEVPEDPDYETPEPPPATDVPDFGLIGGQQLVAGVGNDGYIYRTSDFQTVSGSGGPTWTRVDTTIADTIYSFVVDPFSPGYIAGAGAINGWIANDTAIYRVTDLFGSATATSVFTFPTATVAASFHWRSIQASFGAYFAEGVNPWLMCISYYGSTVGHTGTWCTYSTDGGVTWAAEVQVSKFFDMTTPIRFNPIGVYASPKTPGLGYTAAFTSTLSPANAAGYKTTDWGATWSVLSTSTDSGANPLPMMAIWPDGGSIALLGLSAVAVYEVSELDLDGGGSSVDAGRLIIAPPADTARMEVTVQWSAERSRVGGSSTTSDVFNMENHTFVGLVGADNYVTPAYGSSTADVFSSTFTYTFGNWPVNRDSIVSSPPTSSSDIGSRIRLQVIANGVGAGGLAYHRISIRVTVTEIELDGGHIYTPALPVASLLDPVHAQAGSVHLPWPDNAAEDIAYSGQLTKSGNHQFRLKKSAAGVISDVSPLASAINYGVHHYGFAVRSYDSDRQKMAVGGIGNDTSALTADDKVGLWVSSNAGTAWVNILTPVAASNALHGLQIAFGGDSSSVLFAWGGWSNAASLAAIYYSSNFGTTLDSREGNINSLGTVALLGIAGGPTP